MERIRSIVQDVVAKYSLKKKKSASFKHGKVCSKLIADDGPFSALVPDNSQIWFLLFAKLLNNDKLFEHKKNAPKSSECVDT